MTSPVQSLFDHMEAVRNGARLDVREKRTPSSYQQAILQDVETMVLSPAPERRAVTVRATAGSGKTSLLEMIAETLIRLGLLDGGEKAAFVAFNQEITKELKKRIPTPFEVKTLNSLGHGIVQANRPGLQFEPHKYRDLVHETVADAGIPSPAARAELRDRLTACLDLHVGHGLGLDLELAEWEEHLSLVDAPLSGAEKILHTLTLRVLRHGLAQLDATGGVMSFLDQTLAPMVHGWRLPTPYRFLLVDELQDLSRAHLHLIQAVTDEHSVIVGVGDHSQSLYAFTGADPLAMSRFTETFGATERPLSITYRCPARHVELARPYTDAIEAAPGARPGTLDDITDEEFLALARPGDLALCRTNAPLLDWCYRLVASGVPAVVRGRDLSRTLVAYARDAATWDGRKPQRDQVKDSLELTDFDAKLNAYTEHLAERVRREAEREDKDPGLRIAGLADRMTALQLVLEQGGARTLGQLTEHIRLLFQGDPERSVVLSTVHRAKGLECSRVFILEPELLPHPKARSEQALHTERCLEFVAYTRSKRDLFFVNAENSKIPAGLRGRED